MCVAICCPQGVKTPSMETLRKCWDANSHGAGFAYNDIHTNRVVFHKGFMTWDDFVHAFQKMCKVDKMTDNVRFIHFRITSKGETCPENTHPFPISSNCNDLKLLDGDCKEIMFHNGTFSSLDISEKGISDTMEMAMWVARLKLTSQGLDALSKFLTPFISSNKLGFLNGKGEYSLAGSWSQLDGVYYSNTYWNYTKTTYTTNNSYYGGTYYNTSNKNYNSQYAKATTKYQYDLYDEYGYGTEWGSRFQKEDEQKKDEKKEVQTKVEPRDIVIDKQRVYEIVDDVYGCLDLIDGYCPNEKCPSKEVTYMGSDALYKGDPVFYCGDCNKYFVIKTSYLSVKEQEEIAEYFYAYFGFEGSIVDFLTALHEDGFDDAETITVEVKETEDEVKDEVKDETKETQLVKIPTHNFITDLFNKIKGKKADK